MPKTVRILSIDGGGVRGIIPAIVLASLERITGKRIHELFDLVSGTSTGGILACGLTRPNPPTAADLADVYIQQSPKIFASQPLNVLRNLLSQPKYDSAVIERILGFHLGPSLLSESLTNVMIPSYDIERRAALFFKSWHAATSPAHDFSIASVVRATTAAPTYFAPAMISSVAGVPHACIDGSLVANNPTMCAIASARHLWPDAERTVIMSLGAGEQTRPFRYTDAKTWGALSWARPALDIMMDGITETVDYQIREALADHTHYLRIQTRLGDVLGGPSDEIDDASIGNIKRLIVRGRDLAREFEDDLGAIAGKLMSEAVS